MLEDEEQTTSQLPLLGVIMCCTSITPERRTELAAMATEMGAVHKLDLTADVTHLIVGDTETPKYRYVAKERPDVQALSPSFVEAVRETWLEGGETDVKALEEEHKLPSFEGLRICLTGFNILEERQALIDAIINNGAAYHGDLTKAVTHLIAYTPEGKKYQYATEWGLRVVAREWLSDSLERGMRLDENLYHPLIPEAARGEGAWVREPKSPFNAKKRVRRDAGEMALEPGRRKLRRTASTKLGSQNEGIWNDIVGAAAPVKEVVKNEWEEDDPSPLPDGRTLSFGRASFRSDAVDPEPPKTIASRSFPTISGGQGEQVQSPGGTDSGMLHGLRFCIHGFNQRKAAILTDHLHSHDAHIVPNLNGISSQSREDALNSYLMIPHDMESSDIPRFPESVCAPMTVTEWWLERCLYRKCRVDPLTDVMSKPFPSFPILGFEKLAICSTAFSGTDLMHVAKASRQLGAQYDEFLTPKASVLVCNSSLSNKEKLRHALEWDIPAVRAEWLYDSIAQAQVEPFEKYLIVSNESRVRVLERSKSLSGSAPHERNSLGRSKSFSAREVKQPHTSSAIPQQDSHNRSVGRSLQKSASIGMPVDTAFKATTTKASSTIRVHSLLRHHETTTLPRPQEPLQDIGLAVNSRKKRSSQSPVPDAQTVPEGAKSFDSAAKDESFSDELRNPQITTAENPKNSSKSKSFASSTSNHSFSQDLKNSLASLLAMKRTASVPPSENVSEDNSAAAPKVDDPSKAPRRLQKRRLFGRAPSNLSSLLSNSFSRSESADLTTSGNADPAVSGSESAPPGTSANTADSRPTSAGSLSLPPEDFDNEDHPPLPSQAVSYDDPHVQAQREKMVRKMSGKSGEPVDEDDSLLVAERQKRRPRESIGVVQDLRENGRGRVTRQRRQPGF
ncbi:hypothetical protein L228DRAFT_279888 [Xylona heveae TC161]|uniref:BRCT domain-containing protein n=1 Tax=Xylona heveae (strain CBS 132557 / TC161) TaxID=1328760 RepID=A0A165JWR1_XYLHT|nr:hypothetical protein L228DRAFT_279888 [Xylona heveae TC161]KZF26720.1 hypothetical protein L228DRAFT_279888 [Xylona heveae TC161]